MTSTSLQLSTTTSTTTFTTSTTTYASVQVSTTTLSSVLPALNATFNFAQLTESQALVLLNSPYDLTSCLANCSNNGVCKFDSNKFTCACNSVYLTGQQCQIDTRPCSSNPCLNNGTCIDYISAMAFNSSSYSCTCGKYYEGTRCESEINVCQNETCSNNGNCVDSYNEPKCECFSLYEGDKCESQSAELTTIKKVISIASIIAICTVICFYLCICFMDLTKYCCSKKKIRMKKIRKNKVKPKKKKHSF